MKVVETTVLYEGRLRAVREVVENDYGKRCSHETIEHPGAVVILPILGDGRIICVSQYRHSVRSQVLELPAGTLEAGEEPATCAGREIMEEIGFGARKLIPLGTLFPAPGFCSEVQHLFVARDLFESALEPDEDELIVTVTMTVAELESAVADGRLSDAKSIALFMRARLRGFV